MSRRPTCHQTGTARLPARWLRRQAPPPPWPAGQRPSGGQCPACRESGRLACGHAHHYQAVSLMQHTCSLGRLQAINGLACSWVRTKLVLRAMRATTARTGHGRRYGPSISCPHRRQPCRVSSGLEGGYGAVPQHPSAAGRTCPVLTSSSTQRSYTMAAARSVSHIRATATAVARAWGSAGCSSVAGAALELQLEAAGSGSHVWHQQILSQHAFASASCWARLQHTACPSPGPPT